MRVPGTSGGIAEALAEGDLPTLLEYAQSNPEGVGEAIARNEPVAVALLSDAPAVAASRLWRRVNGALPPHLRRLLLALLSHNLQRQARVLYQTGVKQKREERRPYRPGDDWDLEGTLEAILAAGLKRPGYRDIRAIHRPRRKRTWVLLVDNSNSLSPVLELLTLAVALLLQALQSERLGLIFFNESLEVVQHPSQPLDPHRVLARGLSQDCAGATDLAQALQAAAQMLASVSDPDISRCLLLSDGVPTRGNDPVRVAATLPWLDILHLRPAGLYAPSATERMVGLPQVQVHPIHEPEDVVNAVLAILNSPASS